MHQVLRKFDHALLTDRVTVGNTSTLKLCRLRYAGECFCGADDVGNRSTLHVRLRLAGTVLSPLQEKNEVFSSLYGKHIMCGAE